MYRIMLADDEQIVIDSLKYIIENNFQDVQVIASARSGREAIERVEADLPDIVFMDIGMPGINGLDAIREIKGQYKQIVFIVLTAYDQFDFAKEALELGVLEYLLKPVNRLKVIDVINKAKEQVFAQNESRKKELKMKEKLENILPMLETGFIYSLILLGDNISELQNYKQIFEWQENGGYVMTVEFGEEQKVGELGNKIGSSIRSQNFYPFFRDIIKHRKKCVVGPVMLNRIIVFFPCETTEDEYTIRIDALNIAENLIEKLKSKIDGIKIGIGKAYSDYELLTTSYNDSLTALRYLNESGIMHISDMPSYIEASTGYPLQKEKLLISKVMQGDNTGSMKAMTDIFEWLVYTYRAHPLKLKNKLLEIVFLTSRIAFGDEENYKPIQIYLLEELMLIDDVVELRLWFKKRIESAVSQVSLNHSNKVGILTKTAKKFIEDNFSKSISLEDVAYKINLSPQYFSKLFKDETGENFIDYLTGIRIKEAKSLLSGTDLNIKEICYKIGYGDPNYFSRIFKKVTGSTPTEYKENF